MNLIFCWWCCWSLRWTVSWAVLYFALGSWRVNDRLISLNRLKSADFRITTHHNTGLSLVLYSTSVPWAVRPACTLHMLWKWSLWVKPVFLHYTISVIPGPTAGAFFRVGDHKAGWCSSSHPPLWCDIIDLYHLITALQSSEMPLSELGLWAGSAPWDANELVCMLLN